MMTMAASENAVYLGNLSNSVRIGHLKENIMIVLKTLGIHITKSRIEIINKHNVYAFLYLRSLDEQHHVIDLLQDNAVVSKLDLSDIVPDGKMLKVAPKFQYSNTSHKTILNVDSLHQQSQLGRDLDDENLQIKNYEEHIAARNEMHKQYHDRQRENDRGDHEHINNEHRIGYPGSLPGTEIDPSDPSSENEDIISASCGGEHTASQQDKSYKPMDKLSKKRSNMLRKKKSRLTHNRSVGLNSSFDKNVMVARDSGAHGTSLNGTTLMLGHHVGAESREVEFKQGGGKYTRRVLRDDVSKYMCAFLNSNGGSLFIGVSDTGVAEGIKCSSSDEDRLRCDIDACITSISPGVFPHSYTVHFIPLLDPLSSTVIENLKVVHISVECGDRCVLYETGTGEVFIRRDGSVQGPLKPSAIQHWTKMMMKEEQKKKDNDIKNLEQRHEYLLAELDQRRANEERLKKQLENNKKPVSKLQQQRSLRRSLLHQLVQM